MSTLTDFIAQHDAEDEANKSKLEATQVALTDAQAALAIAEANDAPDKDLISTLQAHLDTAEQAYADLQNEVTDLTVARDAALADAAADDAKIAELQAWKDSHNTESTLTVTTSVAADATQATATVLVTVNPGQQVVDGLFFKRSGASLGADSWESPLRPGLTYSQTFLKLDYDSDYELTVTPQVNGTRGVSVVKQVHTPVSPSSVVRPSFAIGGAYLSNTDPAPLESRLGVKYQTRRTYHGSDFASVVSVIKANIAAGRRVSQVSMKPAYSWVECASGSADAWARDGAQKIAAAIAGTNHWVRIILHHEPESQAVSNTVAGRDNWKNMQIRLSPFFDLPGIEYTIVLMGYHTFNPSSSLYPLWNLDACFPKGSKVKCIGYDPYESKGVTQDGKVQDWKPFDTMYFPKIKAWHTANKISWGFSETGITQSAFDAKPTYFTEMVAALKANGGSFYDYFNTNLNSIADWAMVAGSTREVAFGKLIKANPLS